MSAEAALIIVATPIGNLADLAPRAVEVLASADVVCCEDTRRTRALLSAARVSLRGRRLVSLHGHNEVERIPEVLAALGAGRSVALVSDAGMPGISDPGARLVAAVADAGMTVSVVPGPSSVLAALVVSGLATDRFCVEGFLARRGRVRRRRLEALVAEERTTIVLEAPGRVAATLSELAARLGSRRVAVVRELTKVHEEVWRGTLPEAAEAYAERELRGEVVLVLEGAPPPGPAERDEVAAALQRRLEAGDGPRQAATAVAATLDVPRRAAYELALELQRAAEPAP